MRTWKHPFRSAALRLTTSASSDSSSPSTSRSFASAPTPTPLPTPSFAALDSVERVYCLSDLHTDHAQNLDWLKDRMRRGRLAADPSEPPPPRTTTAPKTVPWSDQDLLVVAGDLSHDERVFEETLLCLLEQGCRVVFVPGNHEAWLDSKDLHLSKGGGGSDPLSATEHSLHKLDRIYQTCRDLGVLVDPCYVPSTTSRSGGGNDDVIVNPLWIVPLQSWYDGTLSFSEELSHGFDHWPWVDFARCRWPPPFLPDLERLPQGLTQHLLQRNVPFLQQLRQQPPVAAPGIAPLSECTVLTFTHFLPCLQTLPDWIDLTASEFDVTAWLDHGAGDMSAKFAKVAGSDLIVRVVCETRVLFLRCALHRSIVVHSLVSYPHCCCCWLVCTGQDAQLRDLVTPFAKRHVHVFGHSHRPKDFEYHGIRYVHNPLGKPRERELCMIDPHVDFQLLWNVETGEVPGQQVLRYWDEFAGGKEALWERLDQVRASLSRGRASSER